MLKELKHWLKQDGNSTIKLAYMLNYKTSTTINNWIARKRIPNYMEPILKEIFQKELK